MPRGPPGKGKKQGKGSPPKKPSMRISDRLSANDKQFAAVAINVPTAGGEGHVVTVIAVPMSWITGSQHGGDLRVWLPWESADSRVFNVLPDIARGKGQMAVALRR
jgi:hypothetical protein